MIPRPALPGRSGLSHGQHLVGTGQHRCRWPKPCSASVGGRFGSGVGFGIFTMNHRISVDITELEGIFRIFEPHFFSIDITFPHGLTSCSCFKMPFSFLVILQPVSFVLRWWWSCSYLRDWRMKCRWWCWTSCWVPSSSRSCEPSSFAKTMEGLETLSWELGVHI